MKSSNNANELNVESRQNDDEIDLFELWSGLVEEKLTVLIVTFVTIALAFGYLSIAKPIYQSEVYFLPPQTKDVQQLNMQNMQNMQNNPVYSSDKVYQVFLQNIQSRSLRKEFFDKHQLINFYANTQEALNENLVFENAFNKC